LTNEAVATTLDQFRALEKSASPQDRLNWRFQQALYRAYYDAYERSRLVYETELEQRALAVLQTAKTVGARRALDQAEAILDRAVTEKVATGWRARVFELAEALFQSIRMQLSVDRYQAISVGRGANLDTIDVPLNDRMWLKRRFAELRLIGEAERLREIEGILHWTDPGPGGFYDDLGNPRCRPHLVREPTSRPDPACFRTPLTGFDFEPEWRRSWCRHAEALFDGPLTLHYPNLDPESAYQVRIVYAGDNFRPRVRLTANGGVEIHPWIKKPNPVQPVEFDIPREVTASGRLTLIWRQEPGRGGNGRGCQVSEVWLIKKKG
jgi:hypothetical protein